MEDVTKFGSAPFVMGNYIHSGYLGTQLTRPEPLEEARGIWVSELGIWVPGFGKFSTGGGSGVGQGISPSFSRGFAFTKSLKLTRFTLRPRPLPPASYRILPPP